MHAPQGQDFVPYSVANSHSQFNLSANTGIKYTLCTRTIVVKQSGGICLSQNKMVCNLVPAKLKALYYSLRIILFTHNYFFH